MPNDSKLSAEIRATQVEEAVFNLIVAQNEAYHATRENRQALEDRVSRARVLLEVALGRALYHSRETNAKTQV